MRGCACDSGKAYRYCCGVYITHELTPATPEALMRSRYTAYSQGNIAYIEETMKLKAAEGFDAGEAAIWAKTARWLGLRVINATQDATQGVVEFVVEYEIDGLKKQLHEISKFKFIDGKWYYVDGVQPKIRRNDLCACGSMKKYKKCCG